MDSVIRTAIIESRREWREKLVALINLTPGFACAGDYATPLEALEEFAAHLPDIVLGNFHFADAGEKKFVRRLRAKYPHLPVLIFNFQDDEDLFGETRKGRGACQLKITMPAGLTRQISSARPAKMPVFDDFMVNILRLLHSLMPPANADCELTPHEKRLLELLVEGHNHTTAARVLKVSYNTVKFHMRNIYQKLEVNSKSAAVAKALRYRLIN